MGLTWLIFAKVPRVVWGMLATLMLIFLAYTFGGQNKASEIARKELETYHETIQKIDRAIVRDGSADGARERLRKTFGPWPGDLRTPVLPRH